MKIKSRIRKLEDGFINRYINRSIVIGMEISDADILRLKDIGFQTLTNGETVLPKNIGPITKFNAYGKETPQKDLPKETVYYQIYWEWEQYAGYDTKERVGEYRDRPVKRFPILITPAPSIELSIVEKDRKKFVVCKKVMVTPEKFDAIILQINIFLEIFHKYTIFNEDLSIPDILIKKVNWNVLPEGTGSWDEYKDQIGVVISELSPLNQKVAWHRIDVFKKYNPDFIAIGNGGFRGYLVFAFPSRSLFILESLYEGNATYGLGQDWETISKLTKSEILTNELHLFRYIHLQDWDRKIRNLFR